MASLISRVKFMSQSWLLQILGAVSALTYDTTTDCIVTVITGVKLGFWCGLHER